VINNQKVVNGAKLVAKYKSIRFFDADIEGGTYYRVQSDQRPAHMGRQTGRQPAA